MKIFFTFIFSLIFFVLPSFSQEDQSWMLWENRVGKRWLTYHLEKEDALKMKKKWEEIGDYSDQSSSDFAGTYYQHGYMSGYFLRWSPEKGYIFVSYFDVEHPCYFSYGDVKTNDAEIEFIQSYEVAEPRCPYNTSPPKIWIPADSGRYFIPKNEISNFANFYAGFNEYNGFFRNPEMEINFAYKWTKNFTAKQQFVFPKGFEKFAKAPITAQIVSVGKTKRKKLKGFFYSDEDNVTETPVEINAGSKDKVRRNLEFALLNSGKDRHQTLIITKVGRKTSKGKIIRYVDKNGKEGFSEYDETKQSFITESFTPIQIGLKVTTSPLPELN